jgi:hypothetical protein
MIGFKINLITLGLFVALYDLIGLGILFGVLHKGKESKESKGWNQLE